jgi:hypothetical protein
MKGESRGVGRRLLDSEAQLAQERGESRESVVERLRWFINSHLLSIAMEPAPDIGPYDAVRHKAGENCKHCKAIADLETLNAVVEAAQELLRVMAAQVSTSAEWANARQRLSIALAALTSEQKHIDFVKHDWHGLKEELVERLPADDPRAGKHGDYAHYGEPHSMTDCPFVSEQKPGKP